ncbi:MAG: 2-oxo acid dehydrogenase subunit E2 [Myxococcota bacterium]
MANFMTLRRKLAIATWSPAREASIYGKVTLDVEPVLHYLKQINAHATEKITITHFVGKAVARALASAPSFNGRIVWGRYVPHKSVDIAFLVNLAEGKDLGKVKVCDVPAKSLQQIATDINKGAQRLRQGRDKNYNKSKLALRLFPTWLIRPIINILGYLSAVVGIPLPIFGLEAFPFGSCIITNIGSFGVEEAYVPPTPFAHVPVYVTITAIKQQPTVRNGQITTAQQLVLTFTIDHRFADGYELSQMMHQLKDAFANPSQL